MFLSWRKIKIGLHNPRLGFAYLIGKKHKWKNINPSLQKKKYTNYQEYTRHQKSKLDHIKHTMMPNYDSKYHNILRERLSEQKYVKPSMNVLCLAARLGTEVRSFLDLGCFAIGLDLNPGKNNKYVVSGDFHNIQFSDNSVDIVFSNSLDHAFKLERLITEMKRVLKPKGLVILEIVRGSKEGVAPGYYESVFWDKTDDVLKLFTKAGFSILKRKSFEYPWKGEHVTLRLK